MGIEGQDWASYQDPQPDPTGLSFAFIKVTQGQTYTNPRWPAQYQWARRHALVVGLYHYPDMRNAARDEMNRFLAVVHAGLGAIPRDVPLILDWEGYDPDNAGVSHANQAAFKDDWLHRIANTMPYNRSILYANTDYWRNVDTTGQFGDALWIATGGLPAGAPGIQTPWLFHQYSDTPVDSDYCPLTSAELRQWVLAPGNPTPPPPAPATDRRRLEEEMV